MATKKFNQNAVIRGAIRRTFARAPVKQELLRENRKEFPKYNKDGTRSKKDAVCYLCNVCKQYVGSTKISVDHIESVISLEDGFIDWNTFIDRVFCNKENLQVICDNCHQVKTNKERFQRTLNKETGVVQALIALTKTNAPLGKEAIKFIKKFTQGRLEKYSDKFKQDIEYLKQYVKNHNNEK